MYKITFQMTSPICYTDLPVFDAIVAYAKYASISKVTDVHTPVGKEIDEIDIPIVKHELGFYLASYMFCDQRIEGKEVWRKRWHEKHDYLADFGKARRRVHVGSGKLKSYDIPVVTQSVKKAWFYFDGDADTIAGLIQDTMPGFGKKVAIGFGWFSKFSIEPEDDRSFLYIRPVPIEFGNELVMAMNGKPIRIRKSFGAYKPPYWLPKNQTDILIPELIDRENFSLDNRAGNHL